LRSLFSDRLDTTILVSLLFLAALYAYATLALFVSPAHFTFLLREMGPLECLGTLGSGLAALFFFAAFLKDGVSNGRLHAAWLLALAFAAGVLAMEEISWGQWIFKFTPPAEIAAVNHQREFNLHNLEVVNSPSHKVGMLLLLLYFVILPLLATVEPIRHVTDAIQIPVPPLRVAAVFAFAYAGFEVFRLIAAPALTDGMNHSELREAAFELVLFLFAATLYARSGEYAAVPQPRQNAVMS
jgi:hypothetical protein